MHVARRVHDARVFQSVCRVTRAFKRTFVMRAKRRVTVFPRAPDPRRQSIVSVLLCLAPIKMEWKEKKIKRSFSLPRDSLLELD